MLEILSQLTGHFPENKTTYPIVAFKIIYLLVFKENTAL